MLIVALKELVRLNIYIFEWKREREKQTRGESWAGRLHPAAIWDKVFFAKGSSAFQLNLQPVISDLL